MIHWHAKNPWRLLRPWLHPQCHPQLRKVKICPVRSKAEVKAVDRHGSASTRCGRGRGNSRPAIARQGGGGLEPAIQGSKPVLSSDCWPHQGTFTFVELGWTLLQDALARQWLRATSTRHSVQLPERAISPAECWIASSNRAEHRSQGCSPIAPVAKQRERLVHASLAHGKGSAGRNWYLQRRGSAVQHDSITLAEGYARAARF